MISASSKNWSQSKRTGGKKDMFTFIPPFLRFVALSADHDLCARGKPSTMVTARVASRDTQLCDIHARSEPTCVSSVALMIVITHSRCDIALSHAIS